MTTAIAPSPSSSVPSAPSVLKSEVPGDFSMDLRTARGVGELLLKDLKHVIDDGLVAGSVRRGKQEGIHDIDLVVRPKWHANLFGHLDPRWSDLFTDCVWKGGPRDAWVTEMSVHAKMRQCRLRSKREPRLKMELWCAFPDNYGWITLIRTGPADFSRELVTAMNENRVPAGRGFHSASGYLERAEDDGRGRLVRIPTPTEQSVFDALGIPFIEPAHRSEWSLGMCRREA